ncbi:MAG: cytochrome d ubiquinol oxidase subunit II [Odoribacter sp.]|nr:cytochrome d ubiquinol oxidase subunit II [Odoribacter sp.]
MMTHIFLQNYWWFIVSLLGSLLVFLMFVQGGQTFIFSLGRDDMQRTMIVNTLGRKWEFTFTTLVTFGGAFFASFPLFYATSFGGAYWVWMAILFSFILQAIAYEYRSKPSNVYGKGTFDFFLLLNGSLGPFLIGVVVATFFTGSQFSLNQMNQVKWETPWHGLEALLNIKNLTLGFAVLLLARINGLLYIINTIDEGKINFNARKKLILNTILFLIFFLVFVIGILVSEGFAVDTETGAVSPEKFKYLHNFLGMPVVLILFLTGVIGLLYGIIISVLKKSSKGIWFTGSGTVLAVLSLLLIAGYNGTAFYPSVFNLQNSLTIRNASSSHFTLKTMTIVSFLIPFVIAYIWYAWKLINNRKIDEDEMRSDGHVY